MMNFQDSYNQKRNKSLLLVSRDVKPSIIAKLEFAIASLSAILAFCCVWHGTSNLCNPTMVELFLITGLASIILSVMNIVAACWKSFNFISGWKYYARVFTVGLFAGINICSMVLAWGSENAISATPNI